MALPSQAPRSMVGARQTVMSRRKARTPGPMAVAAVVGLCGLALTYVVIRPLFVGPSRAGADEGPADANRTGTREASGTPGAGDAAPAAAQQEASSGAGGGTPTLENLVEGARREGRIASGSPVGTTPNPASPPPPTPAVRAASAETPESGTAIPELGAAGVASQTVTAALRAAETEKAANRPVVARQVLLRALAREDLSDLDRSRLREEISTLNDEILFSPRVFPDDPFTSEYVVQPNDSLSRIASRQGLGVDWRAIQRVNGMSSDRIRLGQTLKLIRGPFHAVVDKSDYRLDLFAGPPDERDEWVYIRSFTVGLGEGDGTPLGEFVVKRNSRLINPVWVNPRTGEHFGADDPLNPIGERWVGIRGLGEYEVIEGCGIHGTIDPGSIGQQKSMGCVRMLSGDVELVYELMAEEISRVSIQP